MRESRTVKSCRSVVITAWSPAISIAVEDALPGRPASSRRSGEKKLIFAAGALLWSRA
ncbi:MAG: hypothetical protein ACLRWP_12505 [Bilophila wadsworthia]